MKMRHMSMQIMQKIQPNLGFVKKEYSLKIREFALFSYNFLKNEKKSPKKIVK